MPRAVVAVFAVAVALLMPSAAMGHSGVVLRGLGTAVADGVLAPGEWDAAGRFDFNAPLPAEQGGGTVPVTLYLMNDAQNVYLALRVASPSTAGTTSFLGSFDNNHSGTLYEQGDEVMVFERSTTTASFYDNFINLITNGFCWCIDADYAGTSELSGAYASAAGASYYELVHPLDTADDAHDFSLGPGRRVGLGFDLIHCGPTQCASTQFPPRVSGAPADLAIVSTDRTPPDTQITGGPAEDTIARPANVEFTFTGTDAGIPPDRLLYECKLDNAEYSPCTSPHQTYGYDGSHVLTVRALDDWDLADPSPAQRSWRVDGVGPSRPNVAGPRVTRSRKPTFRFSATDAVTPRNQIRYRCAFDGARLHACGARYRQRLRRGRHLLRVKALDGLDNESGLTRVRVRVKRPR